MLTPWAIEPSLMRKWPQMNTDKETNICVYLRSSVVKIFILIGAD